MWKRAAMRALASESWQKCWGSRLSASATSRTGIWCLLPGGRAEFAGHWKRSFKVDYEPSAKDGQGVRGHDKDALGEAHEVDLAAMRALRGLAGVLHEIARSSDDSAQHTEDGAESVDGNGKDEREA